MILNNTKKILDVAEIEPINDNTYMVKYVLEDGTIDVTIVPNQLDDNEMEKLFEYINNPDKLFEIPNRAGRVYHGVVQRYPINSISCIEYNDRLLEYLSSLYKYVEYIRCNIFMESKVNSKEIDVDALQELSELEQQSKDILKTNSEMVSPIWKKSSSNLYYGDNLQAIYYDSGLDNTEKKASSRKMKFCLASGITDISGLYDYGAYGGPLSYMFICQLYGEEAAKKFKENSIECIETFEYIDSLHKSK